MTNTATPYTVVTHYFINDNEYVIITGKFEGDTENKFRYAGIRREWITDNKINRKLNGAQMFLGETVKETISRITDSENVERLMQTEGLDLMAATIKYFTEKIKRAG